jgi:hypothetical protein
MRSHPRILGTLAAIALATSSGCGSSSAPGFMNVHLVDGPADYEHVWLDVQRVEIHGPDGWVTLGTPDRVVDLLALTGGVSETVADHAPLAAGHYDQMRLVLGPANRLTVAGEGDVALKVPSGIQSGVKLNVSFDVEPGTTKDVFIDFDAHRSVFVHQAGASGKYLLRPVVRAVDRVVSGTISGALRDATSGAPLAGVTVTAQVLDGDEPTVVRSVKTDAEGRYVLDLLPVGGSYYVVSEPVVVVDPLLGTTTTVRPATARGPIALTGADPTVSRDLAVGTLAPAAARLGGSVTGAVSESNADAVAAVQPLDVGGATRKLVVRETPATVNALLLESYDLGLLPAGTYSVVLTRRTLDAAGVEGTTRVVRAGVTVPSSGGVTIDLTVP